jgi:DNA-binding winged helix-turn-helix (wHTH) protein
MRYSFGDYVLDTQRHELHHAGEPVKLRRKVFQVLIYLLVHRDRVVPKQELLEHLWPDQFVGDETLTSCIKTLRKALGERGRTPRFLRTLHGQGYRFVGGGEEGEHRSVDDAAHALPVSGGAGATRQAEGPSPAQYSLLGNLGSPPWLTRRDFFGHDTDPGAFLPLPPGEGGGEGFYAMSPSIPHPNPLPEREGTKYRPQSCPPWEALDGEHKQVTVLCCALAEAPTLAARLGPEPM